MERRRRRSSRGSRPASSGSHPGEQRETGEAGGEDKCKLFDMLIAQMVSDNTMIVWMCEQKLTDTATKLENCDDDVYVCVNGQSSVSK